MRSTDPLNPRRLADHLGIPITRITAMNEVPAVVRYFTQRNTGEFSAVTIFDGPERLIIYNDAHSAGRQASDLAHELAHALLFHQPTPALDPHGCRDWDEVSEREADWLGTALLVSEEAALDIAERGLDLAAAAALYGCSQKVVLMRLNVTGARTRVERARRYPSHLSRCRRAPAPRQARRT